MTTLKLTDKELASLKDCLEANMEAHYQRVEDIKEGDDFQVTKDLVSGFKSLYKKVWGEPLD